MMNLKKELYIFLGCVALMIGLYHSQIIDLYQEHRLRKNTYEFVRECSGLSGREYADIKFKVVGGDAVFVKSDTGSFADEVYFNPQNSTIYIPEANRVHPQIMGRAFLHALGGGDSSPAMGKCQLLYSQRIEME